MSWLIYIHTIFLGLTVSIKLIYCHLRSLVKLRENVNRGGGAWLGGYLVVE